MAIVTAVETSQVRVEVEGERLWLEELGLQHLEDYHELWSSPETLIWSGQTVKKTLEESKAFMLQGLRAAKPDNDQFCLMVSPDPIAKEPNLKPKMIGVIGVIRKGDDGYEFGYTINHRYWKRGYGAKMLQLFAGKEGAYWALEHRKDVPHLVACVDTENFVSSRLVTKLGARRADKILVKAYGLGRDKGPDGIVPEEKMRDLITFYIDRPGIISP